MLNPFFDEAESLPGSPQSPPLEVENRMTRTKSVTVGIAILVTVSFLFVGVGAVAASDDAQGTTGISGHCSDETNGGGGGSYINVTPARVRTTSTPPTVPGRPKASRPPRRTSASRRPHTPSGRTRATAATARTVTTTLRPTPARSMSVTARTTRTAAPGWRRHRRQ